MHKDGMRVEAQFNRDSSKLHVEVSRTQHDRVYSSSDCAKVNTRSEMCCRKG